MLIREGLVSALLGSLYLLKVNNGQSRAMCEFSVELTIKAPKRRQWYCFEVFIVNFEYILYDVLVFPSLTLKKQKADRKSPFTINWALKPLM